MRDASFDAPLDVGRDGAAASPTPFCGGAYGAVDPSPGALSAGAPLGSLPPPRAAWVPGGMMRASPHDGGAASGHVWAVPETPLSADSPEDSQGVACSQLEPSHESLRGVAEAPPSASPAALNQSRLPRACAPSAPPFVPESQW